MPDYQVRNKRTNGKPVFITESQYRDILKNRRDEFEIIGPVGEGAKEAIQAKKEAGGYKVVKRGGPWYDVIGPGGEKVNTKSLKKDDAVLLADQKNAE